MTNLYNSKYTSFVGSDTGYSGFRTRLRLIIFTKIVDPKPNQKILEIGCNQGQLSQNLSRFSRYVYGIDLNKSAIKKIAHPNFKYMPATDIKYPSDFFDKVCAFEVIEHIKDTDKFFSETSRILKPHGQLIISFPFELIRGQSALLDSLSVFGDVNHARQLHLYKFFPKKLTKIANQFSLSTTLSKLVLAPFPTFVMIFNKVK